jgi:magnesium chelatase family protein
VIAARNTQLRRFFDEHIYANAQMGPRQLREYCALTPECEEIMENAVTKLGFSARSYDRILKRNRTTRCSTHCANSKHRSVRLIAATGPWP